MDWYTGDAFNPHAATQSGAAGAPCDVGVTILVCSLMRSVRGQELFYPVNGIALPLAYGARLFPRSNAAASPSDRHGPSMGGSPVMLLVSQNKNVYPAICITICSLVSPLVPRSFAILCLIVPAVSFWFALFSLCSSYSALA